MRPEKLVISAFGPYADKVEINLEKLGQKGIYLITGDTGAGKTTIFDAITFALYGEASGENREASMFRSKYAKPETPTGVELYFSYAGKKYHIKRNPEYERPKSRGEGFTTEKSNAELYLPDGKVITKLKEVNSTVIEIIGIDRNQFTQIAMIAQGDFLKLLLATTEERKKIFQKLFKTHNYYALQEKLRTEAGNLKKEFDTISDSITQYVNGIVCDEDDELFIQVKKAKEKEISYAETLLLIDELIKKDDEAENKYDSDLKKADEESEEITKIITRANTLKTAREALEKAESELKAALLVRDETAKKLKEAEKGKSEADIIIKKIAEIEAVIPIYDEINAHEKEILGIRDEIADMQTESDRLGFKLTECMENIKELEAELKSLENINADKAKLEAEQSELTAKKNSLDNLASLLKELGEVEEKLKKAQEEYLKKSRICIEKKTAFELMNKAYLDEQAGILAGILEDGIPCPVCGSESHPSPAKKSEEAPTKEELQKIKDEMEEAQNEESRASLEAGQLKGMTAEKKAYAEKLSKELLENSSLEEQTEEIALNLRQTQDKLLSIQKSEERREKLEKQLPDKKQEADTLNESILLLNEKNTKDKAILLSLDKAVKEASEKLQFENKAEALEEKTRLEEKRTAIEDELKEAQSSFDENEKRIASAESKIEENQKLLSDTVQINIAEEEAKQEELKEKKEALTILQKKVHARKVSNVSLLENISKKSDEIKEVEERLSWVKALSDTATGSIVGKEKIMLETYIQMTYFDRIIRRANTRLMIMTDNQYELKRRKGAENNRSQSGLELDVIDHYNGSERSVKTLSGGESFKASLSLALGLSDEIQSSAGGIKLDTMFVDEGFGSLDEESLSQAIKALHSLAEGNRLVGIISHVNELKARIDKQIIVTKEKNGGSKVTIEA